MQQYRRLYVVWFAVAIISGATLVKFTYGELGSGNLNAWPWAFGSFVVFAVATPATIYYRGRRHTKSLTEKQEQILELAKIGEDTDGKK